NIFRNKPVLNGEEHGLNEDGFLRIGVDRFEMIASPKYHGAFGAQLLEAFEANALLRFIDNKSHCYSQVPGISYFHHAQTGRNGFAKSVQRLARSENAPDRRTLLADL